MACIRFGHHDAECRKRTIEASGQHVLTSIEVLNDDLLIVQLEPLNGFVHLVQDPEACAAAYGPYHLSVCQIELVSASDLLELRSRWDGCEVTLPVAEVLSEGCMCVGHARLLKIP